MNITVRFLGALQNQMGTSALPLELPEGGTFRDALDAVGPTVQERLPDWAWDPVGRCFSRRMMISLNGTADLRDETVALSEGDEILVVLPLAGG